MSFVSNFVQIEREFNATGLANKWGLMGPE